MLDCVFSKKCVQLQKTILMDIWEWTNESSKVKNVKRFHKSQSYSAVTCAGGVESSSHLTGLLNLQPSGKNLHSLLLPSFELLYQVAFFLPMLILCCFYLIVDSSPLILSVFDKANLAIPHIHMWNCRSIAFWVSAGPAWSLSSF